jgi:hypothetical protein
MKRQPLTDSNSWFDIEAASAFEEGTDWNGSNHISKATGSQWNHEKLYKTRSGRWIKNAWSNYQGSRETWEEINKEEAAAWLVKNGHESDSLEDEIATLEI